MCRLFGFRSVIQSQVHSSLVDAENALGIQSNDHPDGWGVAYYLLDSPHVVKSASSAIGDSIFKRVSGVVSSETVLAHIRKTTQGNNTILNSHPFQFGRWVFAHNGNISDFPKKREHLIDLIPPKFRRFILGETDSELIFYYLLGKLDIQIDIGEKNCNVDQMSDLILAAMETLKKQIGEPAAKDDSGEKATYYTFILTNGKSMAGYQGGKHLNYSTYKKICPERDTCPSFSKFCEAPSQSGQINHLIFSSEPLSGENIWIPMNKGEIVAVDQEMKLTIKN